MTQSRPALTSSSCWIGVEGGRPFPQSERDPIPGNHLSHGGDLYCLLDEYEEK